MNDCLIASSESVSDETTEGISFDDVTGFTREYDYLPYSHQRIKELMIEEYGIELEYIHPGYKGGRYPGYVNSYRLKWADTGEIINPRVKLRALRYFLAKQGHSLYPPKVQRNPRCVEFLEIVDTLKSKA